MDTLLHYRLLIKGSTNVALDTLRARLRGTREYLSITKVGKQAPEFPEVCIDISVPDWAQRGTEQKLNQWVTADRAVPFPAGALLYWARKGA